MSTPNESAKRINSIIFMDYLGGPDTADSITDMLTDIRHFCQQQDINFEDAVRISEGHYDAEQNGEE